MTTVKIHSLDEDIPEETDFICIDICRDRAIKRITNSEALKGKVKNPPIEEDNNVDFKFNTVEYYYYKLWLDIQDNVGVDDKHANLMKKCEEKDVFYTPLAKNETELAMKLIKNSKGIKDIFNILLLKYKNQNIRKAEKILNIRVFEREIQRNILENIKKISKEHDNILLFCREDRIEELSEKIEFETNTINTVTNQS